MRNFQTGSFFQLEEIFTGRTFRRSLRGVMSSWSVGNKSRRLLSSLFRTTAASKQQLSCPLISSSFFYIFSFALILSTVTRGDGCGADLISPTLWSCVCIFFSLFLPLDAQGFLTSSAAAAASFTSCTMV